MSIYFQYVKLNEYIWIYMHASYIRFHLNSKNLCSIKLHKTGQIFVLMCTLGIAINAALGNGLQILSIPFTEDTPIAILRVQMKKITA